MATTPIEVTATGNWSSGTYLYDGSGNIKSIGTNTYRYDTAGRLISATVNGTAYAQTYQYDAFGNRTQSTTSPAQACIGGIACEENVTISASTNHINSSANAPWYDDAGNLGKLDGVTYTYDSQSMLQKQSNTGAQFIYTAQDERVATMAGGGTWTWTIRDLHGLVLSDFTSSGGSGFAWKKNYIYRHRHLLAAAGTSGTQHFHLDHLGTPRLITDASGAEIGAHTYFPYGAELALTPAESPVEPMKFTGHERDYNGSVADLDYMHARYYSSALARFMSMDPGPSDLRKPETWNRYWYTEDDPLKNVDTDGQLTNPVTGEQGKGKPILHQGGGFGEIRQKQPNVQGSASGNYHAPRAGSRKHRGVDIIAPFSTPIVAAFSGTVSEIKQPGKGNKLGFTAVVTAKDGTTAMYGHLSRVTVTEGQKVKEGEQVGDAGRTGNPEKTQPISEDHVHLQVYDDKGNLTDPEKFLNDPKNQETYKQKDDKH